MINLSVRTTTERKTVIVNKEDTVKQILADAEIDAAGKTFQLNGTPLSATDLVASLEALGVEDGSSAMLVAAVKADSAR